MIRPLEPDDHVAFAALRLRGLELHPEAFGTGADDFRAASAAQVRRSLESGGPDDVVLGAFDREVLVGLIGLKREAKFAVRHKATIWGFFVHPDRRRAGHGGALLEQLVDRAGTLEGLDYLRALVTTTSDAALRVFDRAGFSRYGLEAAGIKVDGRSFDQVYLRLNLRCAPERG